MQVQRSIHSQEFIEPVHIHRARTALVIPSKEETLV